MKRQNWIVFAVFFLLVLAARADDAAAPAVVTKFRFMPMKGHEQDVVGGKISGSNISAYDGFVDLGEITTAPANDDWTVVPLNTTTPYRWIKYQAPAGAHGRIGQMQFLANDQPVKVVDVYANIDQASWRGVFSDKPDSHHEDEAPDEWVVADLDVAATGPPPQLIPGGAASTNPVDLQIKSSTPGAVIRYTLDGTIPTLENGQVYSTPLHFDKTTTVNASAFVEGRGPTPPSWGYYVVGPPSQRKTFHIGNSLTGITGRFDFQAKTTGVDHHSDRYLLGGGLTKALWNAAFVPIGDPNDKEGWIKLYTTHLGDTIMYPKEEIENTQKEWADLWPKVTTFTDFTFQPRDFDMAEEADYENRFMNLLFQKSPDAQPWLYIEWTERDQRRPTDKGKEPTTEMTTVYPALSWEESMSAMMLYGEDLKKKVDETYKGKKPIHFIPACLALGQLHHMIALGQMPGITPDEFYGKLFEDTVHLNPDGAYLVDCLFYAAFYGESPEGKFLPLLTRLSPAQAQVMQKLAWDTFSNYPDSGIYQEGTTPVDAPQFSPPAAPIKDVTQVSLSSTTPGAWFRYTLDGTTPTRTTGYIYCGVISARPGMTVKAMAYKSGMADSPVNAVTYPDANATSH